jgi:hypothetical protein
VRRLCVLALAALVACGGGGGDEEDILIPNTSGEHWPEAKGNIVLTPDKDSCPDGYKRAYIEYQHEVIEEGCWQPWQEGKSGYFIIFGDALENDTPTIIEEQG